MRKSDIIGLLLLAFVIGCRFNVRLADFYATQCYPVISRALSWCAARVPFSLEEIIVIGFAVTFIGILVRAIRRKQGFGRWLGKTARVAMWLVVFLHGVGEQLFPDTVVSAHGHSADEFREGGLQRIPFGLFGGDE